MLEANGVREWVRLYPGKHTKSTSQDCEIGTPASRQMILDVSMLYFAKLRMHRIAVWFTHHCTSKLMVQMPPRIASGAALDVFVAPWAVSKDCFRRQG